MKIKNVNAKVPDYGEDSYYGFPSYDSIYQYIGGRGGGGGGGGCGGCGGGVEELFMEFL